MEHNPQMAIDAAPAEVRMSAGGGLDLDRYIGMVLKHKLLVLITTLTVFGVAAAFTLRTLPLYRSAASIIIDVSAPQILKNVEDVVELGADSYWGLKEYYGTQFKLMTGRDVARRAVEKLGLAADPAFLGLDKLPPEQQARLPELIANADPVSRLQGMLNVEPVKNSHMVQIEAVNGNPELAAAIANAVAEAYIDLNLENKLEATQGAISWLSEQVEGLKTQVNAAEQALFDFKRTNNVLGSSLEDRQGIITQNLLALNAKLSEAQAERIRIEAQRKALGKAEERGDLRAGVEAVLKDAMVNSLQLERHEISKELAVLTETYGEKHPLMKAAQARLGKIENALQDRLRGAREGLETEYRMAVDTERGLEQRIDELKKEALDLNGKELENNRLLRDAEHNRALFDTLSTRLKEMNLSRMSNANNVRFFERARPAGGPFSPRTRLNLALGLVVGLLIGVVLSVGIELLDNTVKSQEEAETLLGVPALGTVPRYRGDRAGRRAAAAGKDYSSDRDLYILRHPKSTEAESCRSIRTNLTFMSPDRPATCLLVTSPQPREGKTSNCINLGITFAQANLKTLLVDTDLRRPRLHKTFQVPNDVGISSLIAGQEKLEDCVKATEVENLDLLACGPIPPNPAELLGTRKFEELVAELRKRYDRVILDSPPINLVADSAIISRQADGVVIVIKAGATTLESVRQSVRILGDVKARVLGLLVNDVDTEGRGYRYRYRYGGYYRRANYGYYPSDGDEAPT